MEIAIIKYNAGNIQSVLYALERLGYTASVTDDATKIRTADKVIFPGVGEASTAMRYLEERKLDKLIISLEQPVLGICLGMQLMCNHSEENNTQCLGIFNTMVKRLPAINKVPHVGWNKVDHSGSLFKGMSTDPFCYFLHSYYAERCTQTSAVTEYGVTFSSSLEKNNFYGMQFHPEKSGVVGELILKNFLSI